MFLGKSPESVHRYGAEYTTERLRDQVGWWGLTVMTLSALAKGILAGADTHMAGGAPLSPSEL